MVKTVDIGIEGSTERWVKLLITALIAILVPLAIGVINMNSRLVRAETYQDTFNERSLEKASATNAIMQHMSDQHDVVIRLLDGNQRLLESLAGDDTYQRQVQRERDRYRSDHTPVFPAVK